MLGAAALYALYHVGYGMMGREMIFLFGLGVTYAIAYRLVQNVLVLWPLLMGPNRAKEFLMTGDLVTAQEADRLGLVNHVVPTESVLDEFLTRSRGEPEVLPHRCPGLGLFDVCHQLPPVLPGAVAEVVDAVKHRKIDLPAREVRADLGDAIVQIAQCVGVGVRQFSDGPRWGALPRHVDNARHRPAGNWRPPPNHGIPRL